ncbi:GL17782 [Drosophila persimilis]|uniref:GL17782 n=1 Tax=Drosophila persimilis TaxID=7234 RepID=B4GIZ2_DROPE|nr:GL17782 [Drosophila persimilis]
MIIGQRPQQAGPKTEQKTESGPRSTARQQVAGGGRQEAGRAQQKQRNRAIQPILGAFCPEQKEQKAAHHTVPHRSRARARAGVGAGARPGARPGAYGEH